MNLLHAVVLGAVQGAAEFLPVSSSAHLLIIPWLLRWPAQSLTFDVALHMGTLVAVVTVFWHDLFHIARQSLTRGLQTPESRLGWGMVAATLPVGIAGMLLEDLAETVFRSPLVTAFALAVLGVALWYVDRRARKRKSAEQASFTDAFYIGLAQMIALVPGVSRSGITITAGLLRGLNREGAARISFLLSFPTILGAGMVKLRHITAADLTLPFWAGILTSAVVGYVVIRFMLEYLRRGTYATFAIYRVALAAVIVLLWSLGLRTA